MKDDNLSEYQRVGFQKIADEEDKKMVDLITSRQSVVKVGWNGKEITYVHVPVCLIKK